jgi:hypothetical protein
VNCWSGQSFSQQLHPVGHAIHPSSRQLSVIENQLFEYHYHVGARAYSTSNEQKQSFPNISEEVMQ